MNFDKEKEYKELCKRFKIEDFIEECRSEKIPFFITACVKNDENGSTYLSDASATGSQNIELKDDHIIKHISVLNGFDTVPHRRNIEMIFEEDNQKERGKSKMSEFKTNSSPPSIEKRLSRSYQTGTLLFAKRG